MDDFAAKSDTREGSGRERTAQPQPRQQQFEAEENRMGLVVEECRYIAELETREKEQEEHLKLPPKQHQLLQPPAHHALIAGDLTA